MTELFTTEPADPPPAIHLPDVGEAERREVEEEFSALRERLTDLGVLTPCVGNGCIESGEHFCGSAQVLAFAVAVLEECLDEGTERVDPILAAEFGLFARAAGTAEMMTVQIAFGESAGWLDVREFTRLAAQASQHGMSMDEYVADLVRRGEVGESRMGKSLRGESRRRPDDDRMRRGIAMLRDLAAVLPDELRATCLAMIGWLQWARGKRALALAYLTEAQIKGPPTLTVIALTCIVIGKRPQWIR